MARETAEKIVHSTDVTLADGSVIAVGRLDLDQWLALTRYVARTAAALGKERIEAVEVTVDAQIGDQVAALLSLLDGETVSYLVALVSGPDNTAAQRAQDLRPALDLAAVLDVVDAVLEHNDTARLVATFRRAAQRFSTAA